MSMKKPTFTIIKNDVGCFSAPVSLVLKDSTQKVKSILKTFFLFHFLGNFRTECMRERENPLLIEYLENLFTLPKKDDLQMTNEKLRS